MHAGHHTIMEGIGGNSVLYRSTGGGVSVIAEQCTTSLRSLEHQHARWPLLKLVMRILCACKFAMKNTNYYLLFLKRFSFICFFSLWEKIWHKTITTHMWFCMLNHFGFLSLEQGRSNFFSMTMCIGCSMVCEGRSGWTSTALNTFGMY